QQFVPLRARLGADLREAARADLLLQAAQRLLDADERCRDPHLNYLLRARIELDVGALALAFCLRRVFQHARAFEEAVIGDPRAGLVGGADTLELGRAVAEQPAALVGLRAPVGHAEWPADQRQAIAIREIEVRVRPLQRANEGDEILLVSGGHRHAPWVCQA